MHHKLLRQRRTQGKASSVGDDFRVVSRSSSVDTTESQTNGVAPATGESAAAASAPQSDSASGRNEASRDGHRKPAATVETAAMTQSENSAENGHEPSRDAGNDDRKPAAKSARADSSDPRPAKAAARDSPRQDNQPAATRSSVKKRPKAKKHASPASQSKKHASPKTTTPKLPSPPPPPPSSANSAAAFKSIDGATAVGAAANASSAPRPPAAAVSSSSSSLLNEAATATSSAASESISSELAALNAGMGPSASPNLATAAGLDRLQQHQLLQLQQQLGQGQQQRAAAMAAAASVPSAGNSDLVGLHSLAGLGLPGSALEEEMMLRRALLMQQAAGQTANATALQFADPRSLPDPAGTKQYRTALAEAARAQLSASSINEQLFQLQKQRLMEDYLAEVALRQELQQRSQQRALLNEHLAAFGPSALGGASSLPPSLAAALRNQSSPTTSNSDAGLTAERAMSQNALGLGAIATSDPAILAALRQHITSSRNAQAVSADDYAMLVAASAANSKRKSPTPMTGTSTGAAKRARTSPSVPARAASAGMASTPTDDTNVAAAAQLSMYKSSGNAQIGQKTADHSVPYHAANTSDGEGGVDEDGQSKRFRPYQSEQWTEKFAELMEFSKKHGHCQVPHSYQENPPLARWVKRQRYQYKLKKEGRLSTMTEERVKMLENLGFIWDSHAAAWAEKLNELKDYMSRNGHCNVPVGCSENPQLATWVKCQRRQYKLLRDGKTSNMTMERIMELERIGFVWEMRRVDRSSSQSNGATSMSKSPNEPKAPSKANSAKAAKNAATVALLRQKEEAAAAAAALMQAAKGPRGPVFPSR